MAITINGSGTITGVSAGGLPDGSVTADDLASTLDLGSKTLTIPTNTTGLPSGGLEEVDMWDLSTTVNLSATTDYVPTGWSRVNHDGFEKIGTGLSHSSGIFTFPSTGYYKIDCHYTLQRNGANLDYFYGSIRTTTNNSSYSSASLGHSVMQSSGGVGHTIYTHSMSFIFKVSDTSTHKFKINFYPEAQIYLVADSSQSFTYLTTMKLGDI